MAAEAELARKLAVAEAELKAAEMAAGNAKSAQEEARRLPRRRRRRSCASG